MSSTEVDTTTSADRSTRSSKRKIDRKALLPIELFWRDHQPWLKECGYMLRPRYRPGWVPSWTDGKSWVSHEDSRILRREYLLDAVRISDGQIVMLKRVSKYTHPFEVEITQFFSDEPLASDKRNHCVRTLDVLDIPDEKGHAILVLPLLRAFDDPRIKSIGEAVDFFGQVLEGLQFMHQHHVAHRDCMDLNIMMDPNPTFPHAYHPMSDRRTYNFKRFVKYYTRTARPSKYYLIDFGLSRRFDPEDSAPRAEPIRGGDKSVPEFKNWDKPLDPFPTDIYYLGNMIREVFLQQTRGLEFMEPLVTAMVQTEPSARPTIDQVVKQFIEIRRQLSWMTLRSRLVRADEDAVDCVVRSVTHLTRTMGHILLFRSAIPTDSLQS